jgi:SAM-dependent methyltransferase
VDLKKLEQTWDRFGRIDPMWAVLTHEGKEGGKWDTEEFYATGRDSIAFLMKELGELGLEVPQGPALDFGCGMGRLTQGLAQHFDSVIGVDVARSMVEEAERHNKFRGHVLYVHNDRDDLGQFVDGSFGFVFTMLVLQHMEPRYSKRYIAEFARIVRPGGLFVFQMPGKMPFKHGIKLWVRSRTPRLLLNAFHRIRYGKAPVMDYFLVPPRVVRDVVASTGARILAEREITTAPSRTERFYYCQTAMPTE